jgi:hypothetical protein
MSRRQIIISQGHSLFLKQHLSDFDQVAFFDAQEAQNVFAWVFDNLKHRFIDFNKVVS